MPAEIIGCTLRINAVRISRSSWFSYRSCHPQTRTILNHSSTVTLRLSHVFQATDVSRMSCKLLQVGIFSIRR